LKFIKSQFGENEKKYRAIEEMQEAGKIQITPLAYIRGRSLSNIIFIVDEAQNLTPHEVKTIITRAGENTKIILTGDVRQIDTPYLDEQSNGMSYVIDRLKGNPLYCHVTLEKGERSELANLANEFL
jgi:PhoH-like ATPase